MVGIFLANGFEEIEALAVCDILRRAGIEVSLVSADNTEYVSGAHKINVECDIMIKDVTEDMMEMMFLPGGLPGAYNLRDNARVVELLGEMNAKNKWLGAICAAPLVLGLNGFLEGKRATCYPGFEENLKGAVYTGERAVICDNVITGSGAGSASDFAFEIVKALKDENVAAELKKGMLYE